MESLKSKKFKSFEEHQVTKLNLIKGGAETDSTPVVTPDPSDNTKSSFKSTKGEGYDYCTKGVWTYVYTCYN